MTDVKATADPAQRLPMATAAGLAAHQTAVWRHLRALGADAEVDADLAQEAFVQWLQQRTWHDEGPQALRAWLRRAAWHLFLAHCRAKKRQPPTVDPELLELAWQRAERNDDGDGYRRALGLCLDTLPIDDRELLLQAAAGDIELTALAAARQQNVEALRGQLRRWKQALRTCIERRLHHER
jgi:RNA polymerase sigma-70 factor, ECF subfamily